MPCERDKMIEQNVISEFISALTGYMRTTAPTLTIDEDSMGPSRKILGQFTKRETQIRAYRAICCYMQRGLGTHVDVVGRLVYAITSFQWSQGQRNPYFFHLFSFGWEDNVLHHYPRAHELCGMHQKSVAVSLCRLAGVDNANNVPFVPTLFPTAVNIYNVHANVGREDLRVFFCTDRSVKLSAAAKRSYSQRNTVWIFLTDDSLDFEVGKFMPEFL